MWFVESNLLSRWKVVQTSDAVTLVKITPSEYIPRASPLRFPEFFTKTNSLVNHNIFCVLVFFFFVKFIKISKKIFMWWAHFLCVELIFCVLGVLSRPCHVVFFINLAPNNYLKVTNIERNESRGIYRNPKFGSGSKMTKHAEIPKNWSIWVAIEPSSYDLVYFLN